MKFIRLFLNYTKGRTGKSISSKVVFGSLLSFGNKDAKKENI
jgi:hypothetical protein